MAKFEAIENIGEAVKQAVQGKATLELDSLYYTMFAAMRNNFRKYKDTFKKVEKLTKSKEHLNAIKVVASQIDREVELIEYILQNKKAKDLSKVVDEFNALTPTLNQAIVDTLNAVYTDIELVSKLQENVPEFFKETEVMEAAVDMFAQRSEGAYKRKGGLKGLSERFSKQTEGISGFLGGYTENQGVFVKEGKYKNLINVGAMGLMGALGPLGALGMMLGTGISGGIKMVNQMRGKTAKTGRVRAGVSAVGEELGITKEQAEYLRSTYAHGQGPIEGYSTGYGVFESAQRGASAEYTRGTGSGERVSGQRASATRPHVIGETPSMARAAIGGLVGGTMLGGLVSFFSKDAFTAPYTKDLLDSIKKGGKAGAGGDLLGSIGQLFKKGGIGRFLTPAAGGVAAGVAGIAMGAWDAFQAQKKAGSWFGRGEGERVPIGERVASGVGGFLGGTGKGFGEKGGSTGEAIKNTLWNAAKGAGIGLMVGGPIGALIGGVAGAATGAIGGKRIAQATEAIAEKGTDAAMMMAGGPLFGAKWAKESQQKRDAAKKAFRENEKARLATEGIVPEAVTTSNVERMMAEKNVIGANVATMGAAANAKAISDAVAKAVKPPVTVGTLSTKNVEQMTRNKDILLENLITGELDEAW